MREQGEQGPGGGWTRLYMALLRCMPRSFRERHAGEIERTLAEGADGARGARLGIGAVIDLLWGLLAEWGRAVGRFFLRDLGNDIRIGLRGLWRAPGFTALAVVALALGMGANASVFSLVNEIVLQPLPVHQPDRLVNIYLDQPGANSFTGFSWPEYLDYRDAGAGLDGIAALSGIGVRYGEPGTEVRVGAAMVTDNYFDVLGVEAGRGRLFTPQEVAAAETVAVVSEGFWRRRLGGAPAVGARVRLNDMVFTIVGVLPQGFSGTFIGFPAEVWIPVTLMERMRPGSDLEARSEQPLEMFGRLPAGGSVAAADAALDAVAAELEESYPVLYRERRVKLFGMTGIDESMYEGVVGFVGVLLALSGLVLVTACLNVGGMLLARGSYRAHEMSLRAALGAPRWRLVRQVLVEAVALFALGTAAAIAVALQLNGVLRRFIEALPVPIGFDLQLDAGVLGFTLAVGLAAAVSTALSPALRVSGCSPTAALASGTRLTGAGQGTRRVFLVVQVAMSLILLVCAGLFVRAAQRGSRIDTGFDVDALTTTRIGLPAERYDEATALAFFEQLAARLRASSEVSAVSFSALPPIDVARSVMTARVPGFVDDDGDDEGAVDVNAVGHGYFAGIGLPVIAGRAFEPADQGGQRRVAVVNRTAAERFWPRRPPLGRVLFLDGVGTEVIGVVEDSRTVIQDPAPTALVYVPAEQQPSRRMTMVTRSDADLGALNRLVRREVAGLDASLPPPTTEPLVEIIELSMLPQRLAGQFAAGLGALALALVVCGMYGIVSYNVGCRRRELGVRVALGARPGRMVALVMRGGLGPLVSGLAVGAAGIAALTPVLRRFLLDVSPFDPLAFGGAALLLTAIAAFASWLPARGAARIDPAVAFRNE